MTDFLGGIDVWEWRNARIVSGETPISWDSYSPSEESCPPRNQHFGRLHKVTN